MKNYYVLLGLFFSLLTTVSAQTTEILTGLSNPRGLAVNGNDLYIVEIAANRVVKIDLTQTNPTPVEVVTGLDTPRELVFNDDTLYITENNRISKVDITSTLPATRQDFFNGLAFPQGIFVYNNYLYGVSGAPANIIKFDLSSNNPTAELVINGSIAGFTGISDFVRIDNDVYIADFGQILKFDVTEANPTVENVITPEDFPGITGANSGISRIANTIYFVKSNTREILSFDITDPTGTISLLTTLNDISNTSPSDITVFDNNLFIADVGNDRIIKYELPNNPNTCTVAHTVSNFNISVDANGYMWGQSFDAECSGQLESVAFISGGTGTISAGTLNIYVGETVTDTPIYTQAHPEIVVGQSGDPIQVDITGSVPVTEGERYTFEFRVTNVNTLIDFNATYPNGINFQNGSPTNGGPGGTPADFPFNVSITEEASVTCFPDNFSDFDTATAGNLTGLQTNSATTTVDCWDFTVNSNGGVTITLAGGGGPNPGGAGDHQVNLTRAGGNTNALGSVSFKANDNSAFKLNSLYVRPNFDPSGSPMSLLIIGYRNGNQILDAVAPYSNLTNNQWLLMNLTTNANFNDVDEIRFIQNGIADWAALSIDEIDITPATLGIDDAVLETIGLYPNPAKNHIQITNLKTSENYSIYNLLGQKTMQGKTTPNTFIDISSLAKGMYLLKLENTQNTLRFIKQ